MKAIRLTKAEAAVIRDALTLLCSPWGTAEASKKKAALSIKAKLDAAEAPSAPGVNPGPLQDALVATSYGKVVPLVGSGGWGRASRQASSVGATVDDARAIGAWMARQAWLRGPQTLLDVLNKWPQWLAKARATEPPPSALPGLGDAAAEKDAHPRQGPGQQGQGAPGRLRPGF